MSLLPGVGVAIDALGGALVLALGLYVAAVRPRRRANLVLAAFAVCFGAWALLTNLYATEDPEASVLGAVAQPLMLGYAAALLLLALVVPRPVVRGEWRRLALAGLLVVPYVPVATGMVAPAGVDDGVFGLVVRTLYVTGFLAALAVLAMRFPVAPDRGARQQAALVSAALALQPGLVLGGIAVGLVQVLGLAVLGVLAAVWLWNAAQLPEDARPARNVALVLLAVPAAAMALRLGWISNPAAFADSGVFGAARVFGVALLVYAILRHQLLGIDVKVKWTIKQSTVAAAFIGVFFVVSEGAASVLSESLGPMLGIAAAGMLVFAIHPLQRAAEKVASAAMPGVRATGELAPDERVAFYREHLEVAYRDGAVDAGERALLRTLQRRLALSPEEAARVEDEVLRAREAVQ